MNNARYGKGDRPRNNWGPKWYAGYTAVNWHRTIGRLPISNLSGRDSRPLKTIGRSHFNH